MDDLKRIRRSVKRIELYNTFPTTVVIVLALVALMAFGWFIETVLKSTTLTVLVLTAAIMYLFRRPLRKWRERSDETSVKFDEGSTGRDAGSRQDSREHPGPDFEPGDRMGSGVKRNVL